jgi:hypothetical protein
MTRNVRTIPKAPDTHPFPVSLLEMWIVVAIQLVGLVVSLIIH